MFRICFVLTVLAMDAIASAQIPFDGYKVTTPRWCLFDPYKVSPVTQCLTTEEIDQRSAMKLVFPEGVLGSPDHELGWVVLTNPTSDLEQFALEFIIDGQPTRSRVISQAFGNTRVPIELHGRLEFRGIVTFSVVVYCESTCAARLVLRPAHDPLSKEIILTPDTFAHAVTQ